MNDVQAKAGGAPAPSALTAARPVIALVVICMVAGVLLGVVHQMTAPLAEANAAARAQATYEELIPTATAFEPVDCAIEGCTAVLEAKDSTGTLIGYVVVAESKGYGGPVPVAVAFDTNGTVTSITVMANSETPGLGTRVSDESYIGQYIGLEAKPVTADDIDLISGATISSKAALAAFNHAVEAYEEVH